MVAVEVGLPHRCECTQGAAVMTPLARTYRLPRGFAVTFTVDTGNAAFLAEWSPRLPTPREQRTLIDAYRAARHRFLVELSEQIGGTVACVEV